ncbi:uncharacterized protein BXZ73DRAFT_46636 [Epithele typhae]|uniref:uncharacterized protein n=1 Tax=Epithele typhae TaxID=378194 RepID=UPI002007C878|nr:uncharacterized protein BXZ73DRAFT_46636 [Epithele typhae]KAH9932748.1 hypothetical protein BXZ73DRAFT_46636 [Epithele typhae]
MFPFLKANALVASLALSAAATGVIWDGRAPLNLTAADLDSSTGPFLTVVKGSEAASHYSQLLGDTLAPTALWNPYGPSEQALAVSIDNSSIFVPGSGGPQNGFRRTDIIAAVDGQHDALLTQMETGVTVFHFSVMQDAARPLNYSHEYQIVFIEPNDGTHVFDLQLGSPFTNPTGAVPVADAHSFKLRDHARDVLFETGFSAGAWHNFAVEVDWSARTLAAFYSQDGAALAQVVPPTGNPTASAGTAGQGDFHFTVLKLPLVNPADSSADQNDVVHFGIQEGTTEGLIYSGVFVEGSAGGISGQASD